MVVDKSNLRDLSEVKKFMKFHKKTQKNCDLLRGIFFT